MDIQSIIGLVSLLAIVLGVGATWQRSKSRSEENRQRILEEQITRENEVKRLEGIIKDNEKGSKERADISKSLVVQSETRLSESIKVLMLSREAHDKETSEMLLALNTSMQGLGAIVGELKGIVNTFIGEYRSSNNRKV